MCEENFFHVLDPESLQQPIALTLDDTGSEHDLIDLFDQGSSFQCEFYQHDGNIERVCKYRCSLFDDHIHRRHRFFRHIISIQTKRHGR